MCSRCAVLEARVRELEEEAGLRLSLPAAVFKAMTVTASQAYVIATLYIAKDYISRLDLDKAVPVVNPNGMSDPEFRTLSGISVFIWQLKQIYGQHFITARRGSLGGYKLSETGREMVREALAA